MRKTFEFYEDPGHGWLKVKREEIKELGIENQISHFSYKRNGDVYLEEDCDASIFMKVYQNRFNKKPNINVHISNKQSKIRNYESY